MKNLNVFVILYVVGEDKSGPAEVRENQAISSTACAIHLIQKHRTCIAGTKSRLNPWLSGQSLRWTGRSQVKQSRFL
jgi:hypothetical protein